MPHIYLLDSTLRDGAQGEDISFSLQDKLNIARTLDDFGIDFIEAGIPGANPKDLQFFQKAARMSFSHAKICAFGATRHKGISPQQDEFLNLLLSAETSHVVIFGKAWLLHVDKILKATPQENLDMIADTIQFLRDHGRTVLFDAEHFFDGYADNPDYALQTIRAAIQAGAHSVTLCDTNGGCTPTALRQTTAEILQALGKDITIGIHCHNDIGCAIANSMLAVEAGATLVQGTFSGYGERCGNADLSVLIPNLILKKNCTCSVTRLHELVDVATKLAEISNISIPSTKPYIGKSAFAHKGGMHIDGVTKLTSSFEHIAPEAIGNHRRFLTSEISGRSTLLAKMKSFAPQFTKDSPEISRIVEKLKEMEFRGYQFEAADASLELLIRRTLGWHKPHFQLILYKTTGEYPAPNDCEPTSAMIQIKVEDTTEITAALGNGPVNALDLALRKALHVFYPNLEEVQLIDYKVRVIDSDAATAAKVRVLIESTDGSHSWTTVGVSTDIIEASWLALQDSIEYKLDILK
ncbi:MAG: citramalate synthase [Victivallales bacterium]|nr:citramalate synthase [Victivallales bacterium]